VCVIIVVLDKVALVRQTIPSVRVFNRRHHHHHHHHHYYDCVWRFILILKVINANQSAKKKHNIK
jgi:hypothetical protein